MDMMDELADAIIRYTDAQDGNGPFATAIEGFGILRSDQDRQLSHLMFRHSLLCMVVRGAKHSTFGAERYDYPAGRSLVVSVDTPGSSVATAEGPGRPFLGLVIGLDPAILRDVLEQLPAPPASDGNALHGIFVEACDGALADCALRAMRLLDTPEAIPML